MILNRQDSLVITLGAPHTTTAPDWHASSIGRRFFGVTDGTTVVDMIPVIAPSKRQRIDWVSVRNRDTVSHTVAIGIKNSDTTVGVVVVTLAAGDHLEWAPEHGWRRLTSAGVLAVSTSEGGGGGGVSTFLGGYTVQYEKVATGTMESAAIHHSLHALAGFPGAWAPGTPGLAGRATDGTLTADNGCLRIETPSSGYAYLVGYQAVGNVAQAHFLHDILWINSGIVSATLTAQTVNSVAFPARDNNGSTNGAGVRVGLLVTTATTNAGAITNTTISYTNSDGTSGRTGTITSFPATAVAGTIVWFNLAAGDTGVRSIQSVTLGTTYGTGVLSLIAARRLALVGGLVANTYFNAPLRPADQLGGGVRLYAGSCILPGIYTTATTTTIASGLLTIEER